MTLLFPTVTIHQSQTLEIFHKPHNHQSSFFKEKKNYYLLELANTITYNTNRNWQLQNRKQESAISEAPAESRAILFED